ncbi:hypothetical protein GCM10009682_39150 [Luedemannella flava]|uniref:histidine kinase n=1 Tax=Luedemannella flava TaxID=349316 RepID=A0ABN2M837_9ACTN
MTIATLVRAAGWLLGTALVVVGTAKVPPDAGERPADALAQVVAVGAGVAVAAAWRWPLAATVVPVALAVYAGRHYPDGPVLLTALATVYALGATRSRRLAYPVAAGLAAVVVVAGAVADGGPGLVDVAFVGWSAAAVFAADAVRGMRDRRAARLERDRLTAEARSRDERLRLARDLHDTVAHAMAAINVQAGMAGQVIDVRPDLAKEALEVVRKVSGDVLDELNTMVRVLRHGAPTAPTPGLADLADLVRTAESAGTAVDLLVEPAPDAVSSPVALAVYRIVQESLTNVARHAGAANARVAVTYGEGGGLRVEVTDDGGAAAPGAGSGVGIPGMRERAEATGGSLSAGPRPGGGFAVVAHWPAPR